MDNAKVPTIAKWPFFLGDAILLGFAAYSVYSGAQTLVWVLAAAAAVIAGAWLAVHPYVLEYRALVRWVEADALQSCTDKLKGMDQVVQHIDVATNQWRGMLLEATNISELTKMVAGQMASETKAFSDFLQKSNEADKSRLRLEIDKLRRNEGEWLQVTVGILDHVYALFQAAVHSGQPGLIQQLSMFQNACRDVARRIGLVPLLPNPGDPFDPKTHHLEDANAKPEPDELICLVLAPGYTYQGQFLRPALVRLQKATPPTANPETETTPIAPEPIATEPSANASGVTAEPGAEPSPAAPETPATQPPPHRTISEQNLF
jgi:molecular chaperone GrpE (heat shock protein)